MQYTLRGGLPLVLFFVGLAAGALALVLTPREEEPQIVVPMVDVLVRAPGLSATQVERQVAVPLEKLLAQADVVSLHLPAMAETRGLVNAAFLGQMKLGAILVNTARGEIINEADLLAALQSGHLRGAGLDAFASEPPGADNPLLQLPQVIATPHTGAHTDGATNGMGWGALRNLLAALRGEAPPDQIV